MNDKQMMLASKVKLIALDLDGTLLRDDMTISEANVAAVKSAIDAGIQVMVATGRSMSVASQYIAKLGLTGPQVLVNGGEIWSDPHTLKERKLLNSSDVLRLHLLAETYRVWFWAYSPEGVFNRDKPPADLSKHQWLKFGYHTENDEVRQFIHEQILSWNVFEVSNSSPWNIEVNPVGVNKATAIQKVCDGLGIDMKEVAAMGDSLNDMAMIRGVGFGIAMGNAQDALRAEAKWHTRSNEDDGVAYAIRAIIAEQDRR